METQKIHKNTFEGGLNTDFVNNLANNNQYLDAHNLSLVESGNFFALQDIKGTTNLSTITTLNDVRTLAVFANKYTIGDETNVECLTIFTYEINGAGSAAEFKIYCYAVDTDTLYTLYTEEAPVENNVTGEIIFTIDGVQYPEAGLDILYFTDYRTRPKKLRCYIPDPYSANFLEELDLDLLKIPALGIIDVANVTSGGSLLIGTYQLAYQLFNPESGKYTNFSLLTLPVTVSTTVGDFVVAGIGLNSDKKITINITPTEDELAYYTHFRVAVVENIGAVENSTVNVGVTKAYLISDYISTSQIYNFDIVSNTQYNYTTIDEIVIDLAGLERVRTLAIRDNRLLLGNAILANLEYDNGTPEVDSGSIILQRGSVGVDSSELDIYTTNSKGYFRDEVYRFAISYFDEYGNYSSPKTLDLSGVTHNQITGSVDMRFPKISQYLDTVYYSLLDANHRAVSLGLQLNDITNHPSWAKGFVILRAKRKKKILFQTPVLPMAKLWGSGAVQQYPTIRREGSGLTVVTDTTATPMGPSECFIPYNMFLGAPIGGVGYRSIAGGAGQAEYFIDELYSLGNQLETEKVLLFPPQNIYKNEAFQFTGNEQLDPVDAILCQTYMNRFDATGVDSGEHIDTNVSGSFFAVENDYRYFHYGHAGLKSDIRSGQTLVINNTKPFDNYGEGGSVVGDRVLDYSAFKTGNVSLGATPIVHRGVVGDVPYEHGSWIRGLAFDAGAAVFKATSGGFTYDNAFIDNTTGLSTSPNNPLEIANVITTQSDNRYGEVDDYNEFIFTGRKVFFTNSEVINYIEPKVPLPKSVSVFGGDCIISPHTFKVSDTTYSMLNQEKAINSGLPPSTIATNFTKVWTNSGGTSVVCLPVFLKGAAQYVTVILENEYNGAVNDLEQYDLVTTVSGYKIKGASTESKIHVPRTYNYNINLNKQNDQKLFVPVDEFTPVVTNLKSRVYYTDLKIYQTDIVGFDSVRVLNYLDLEEKYGALTKLTLVGDRLYALQEAGISVIPVGERVLETTDLSQLAVRSGEFLSTPVYIDTLRGCQHLGSVKQTGDTTFFLDKINRAIYSLSSEGLKIISENGLATNLRTILAPTAQLSDLIVRSVYHPIKTQYWLALGDTSYIWNNRLQLWETKYDRVFTGGATINNELFFTGQEDTTLDTTVYSMYTGDYNSFMGTLLTPSVTFVANPDGDYTKVYDSLLINTNDSLDSVELETGVTPTGFTQYTHTTALSTKRGEGNYKVKVMRDENGPIDANGDFKNRLRWPYVKITVNWAEGATSVNGINLTSVLTKYTPSFNIF